MALCSITVVGLGPGRRGLLTIDALEALRAATRLYLRTARHPAVVEIRGDLRPDVQIHTFDGLCATAPSREAACLRIAETLLAAVAEGPLVYAVPGHPLMGERSVGLLLDGAAERRLEVHVVDGLGALDHIFGALGRDPLAGALQIVDALEAGGDPVRSVGGEADAIRGLQALWTGPSSRLLNAQAPLLVTNFHDADALARVRQWLLARYPAEHGVTLVCGAGTSDQATISLPLAALDQVTVGCAARPTQGEDCRRPSDPVALYVPPLAPLDDVRTPNTLGYITARLRGPGGCPWDREQTHASLTPYMIEEAYEAVDAIERADDADLVEELGDVLLQVVLHSQLAEEEGRFNLADVAEAVNRKLVRRHPHVFGDVRVRGSSEVLRNWERIKRAEKAAPQGGAPPSALDGIPPALPALALAQAIGRKAAKLGFDWPDVEGTLAKVREEVDELGAAATDAERRDEVGDLLYALTSVCRHLGIDAEDALRTAARKFAGRFRRVEAYAQARNLDLAAMSIAELDALWEEAKVDQATGDRR
jgi:tetrapyrrole methylase family protein / MazG family protein